MDILAVAQGLGELLPALAAEGESGAGLAINLFWVIVAAGNFIVFFFIVYRLVLGPVGVRLAERRERIEQGLKDADAARRDREAAADQRAAVLAEARREAGEIVSRAQRMAEEARQAGVAQTQADIDRMRERAVAEIDAERQRALVDVRGHVADLALLAAGRLVGETMSDERQRRLVNDFLAQVPAVPPGGADRN